MHPGLLKEIVELCKRRQAAGDLPTEPIADAEVLENAIVQLASTHYCWLIENGKKQGEGIAYRRMDQGIPTWTEDPHKAMRFARRADAEMFAEEDEDAWRIVEHGFEA